MSSELEHELTVAEVSNNPEHMLTTVDNPFNPHTNFGAWYAYDISNGYNTSSLLARVTKTSDSLSEADQDLAIETAIDEIVELNASGMHTKVAAPAS